MICSCTEIVSRTQNNFYRWFIIFKRLNDFFIKKYALVSFEYLENNFWVFVRSCMHKLSHMLSYDIHSTTCFLLGFGNQENIRRDLCPRFLDRKSCILKLQAQIETRLAEWFVLPYQMHIISM